MATQMPSSLEIAQEAALRPIAEIAEELGLEPDEYDLYGRYKAKVDLSVVERLADRPDGKLVCVTAITPTKAGEGKTTTSVSLTQGLGHIGRKVALCLREASLGPVFGIKGGAAGGGYAQVVPMEDLNLHFTGDIHAIGAANNLLAAMLEAHLLHGNARGIDPLSVGWRRCVDINDRSLRQIVLGLGGRANGYPRETGFDITAASEVMAILAVARDLHDLRRRLGAITVGYTWEGEPVTAEQLHAAGAMTVLLKDAIKPNLVQTLEGQAAFVHCGPFANIAHGNNSLVAEAHLRFADRPRRVPDRSRDRALHDLQDRRHVPLPRILRSSRARALPPARERADPENVVRHLRPVARLQPDPRRDRGQGLPHLDRLGHVRLQGRAHRGDDACRADRDQKDSRTH